MKSLIKKLVTRKRIVDRDIEEELYDICNDVHASCDCECPVYEINEGPVNPDKPFEENRGCDCFKNGRKMLNFLRANMN